MFKRILVLIIALSATQAYPCRICRDNADPETATYRESYGHKNFQFKPFFDLLQSNYPRPSKTWLHSDYMFIGTQRIVAYRNPIKYREPLKLLEGDLGVPIPVEMFTSFRDSIRDAVKTKLGLPGNMADLIADELERQAVEVAHIEYSEFKKYVQRPAHREINFADIMHYAYQKFPPVHTYDVPSVAGYAVDGIKPYIDRDVPLRKTLEDGRSYPVGPALTLHELIEKTMLSTFQTTYPHAHQAALRIEHWAVIDNFQPRADFHRGSISKSERADILKNNRHWKTYDDYMIKIIDKIGAKRLTKMAADFDATPDFSFKDEESRKAQARIKELIAKAQCSLKLNRKR